MLKTVLIFITTVTLVLTGCSSNKKSRYAIKTDRAPLNPKSLHLVEDAIPKKVPKSKYGNPKSYTVLGKKYHVMPSSLGYRERGGASWYGEKFHGHNTSNGEVYDMYKMTAAHKTLPIPTYVSVKNLKNGKSVIVKINDRGPFHDGRIIDLSYAAAHKLDIYKHGTANVEVTAIEPEKWYAQNNSIINDTSQPKHEITGNAVMYLQAGAYKEFDRAENIAKLIRKAGDYQVRIKPEAQKNNILYKVHVGPFSNTEDLTPYRQQIAQIAEHTPFLVYP